MVTGYPFGSNSPRFNYSVRGGVKPWTNPDTGQVIRNFPQQNPMNAYFTQLADPEYRQAMQQQNLFSNLLNFGAQMSAAGAPSLDPGYAGRTRAGALAGLGKGLMSGNQAYRDQMMNAIKLKSMMETNKRAQAMHDVDLKTKQAALARQENWAKQFKTPTQAAAAPLTEADYKEEFDYGDSPEGATMVESPSALPTAPKIGQVPEQFAALGITPEKWQAIGLLPYEEGKEVLKNIINKTPAVGWANVDGKPVLMPNTEIMAQGLPKWEKSDVRSEERLTQDLSVADAQRMRAPLTDAQAKSGTFALRMHGARDKLLASSAGPDKKIGTADDYVPSRSELVAFGLPGGNQLVSSQFRQHRQAEDDWISANLRKESGAVIGIEEMAEERKKYFPQPGDKAPVIAQKARSRKTAEAAMKVASGRAFELMKTELGGKNPYSGFEVLD